MLSWWERHSISTLSTSSRLLTKVQNKLESRRKYRVTCTPFAWSIALLTHSLPHFTALVHSNALPRSFMEKQAVCTIVRSSSVSVCLSRAVLVELWHSITAGKLSNGVLLHSFSRALRCAHSECFAALICMRAPLRSYVRAFRCTYLLAHSAALICWPALLHSFPCALRCAYSLRCTVFQAEHLEEWQWGDCCCCWSQGYRWVNGFHHCHSLYLHPHCHE